MEKTGKFKTGEFAFSKAGHDKKDLYIIVYEDETYVYIADGVNKKAASPKRKNKKHIQVIHFCDMRIADKLNKHEAISDEDIVGAIADYKARSLELKEGK